MLQKIINKRITTEVTTMLTTSTKPLKDIAHSMGFSSQAQLSRFIKTMRYPALFYEISGAFL